MSKAESWSLFISGQFLGLKAGFGAIVEQLLPGSPLHRADAGADTASPGRALWAAAPAAAGTPRSHGGERAEVPAAAGGGIARGAPGCTAPSQAAPARTHPPERGAASGPLAGPKAGGWEQVAHPGTWVRIPGPKGHLSGSTYASLFAPEEMFSS